MNIEKQKNDEIVKIIMLLNNYDSDIIKNVRYLIGYNNLEKIKKIRISLEHLKKSDIANKNEVFKLIIILFKNKSFELIGNTFHGKIGYQIYIINYISGKITTQKSQNNTISSLNHDKLLIKKH
ncbi:MAG: hypothetical protein PHN42_02860 [Bacilli bacterium]|nr:hypothetical protein [Bacilli bacterium]